MRNDSADVARIAATPKRTSRAAKLLHAAALATMLVPLGAVAAEAASINCVTGNTCSGSYSSSGGLQSNTWNVYDSIVNVGSGQILGTLMYTFTISGTPQSDFTLFVTDVLTESFSVNFYYPNSQVPVFATCVETFAGQCGLFNVTASGDPTWSDGYRATIVWDAGQQNPPPDTVTVLKSELVNIDNLYTDININIDTWTPLSEIRYAPTLPLLPGDPGIGGKGTAFSRFGVFEGPDVEPATVVSTKAELFAVPEPASSLVLLGMGLVGLAVRARRWKR